MLATKDRSDGFGSGVAVGKDAEGHAWLALPAPGSGQVYAVNRSQLNDADAAGSLLELPADDAVFALSNGDVLTGEVAVGDLDQDGSKDDMIIGGEQRWYALTDAFAARPDASGTCSGGAACFGLRRPSSEILPGPAVIGRNDSGSKFLALADPSRRGGPGSCTCSTPAAPPRAPTTSDDADLRVVGLDGSAGTALAVAHPYPHDLLLVAEPGLDLSGDRDIGGVFLLDVRSR